MRELRFPRALHAGNNPTTPDNDLQNTEREMTLRQKCLLLLVTALLQPYWQTAYGECKQTKTAKVEVKLGKKLLKGGRVHAYWEGYLWACKGEFDERACRCNGALGWVLAGKRDGKSSLRNDPEVLRAARGQGFGIKVWLVVDGYRLESSKKEISWVGSGKLAQIYVVRNGNSVQIGLQRPKK
ncbi:MAG: hypothetical protein KDA37_08085 [Planctomycetales bacterium]|nr:hypothetical protein [Planctomycetales bacterium]